MGDVLIDGKPTVQEWEGRLNVSMSNSVTTAIRESVREMTIGKTKTTEKANRAIVEQAIDPRTCMVLFKMLNRACTSFNSYKVLIVGDRDRYVQGDYHFRHGYCRHNPRKMVKIWAKKEMRNLMRESRLGHILALLMEPLELGTRGHSSRFHV